MTKQDFRDAFNYLLDNTLTVGLNKESLMIELMKAVDIWEQKEMDRISGKSDNPNFLKTFYNKIKNIFKRGT